MFSRTVRSKRQTGPSLQWNRKRFSSTCSHHDSRQAHLVILVDENGATGAADIAVAGGGPDPAHLPQRPARCVGHELVSAIGRIGGMNKGTVFAEGRRLGKRNWINCKRLG
jgi:hypothetical protein